MPKHSIRQLLLAARRALSPDEVKRRSLLVQHSFIQSELFLRIESLALYSPIQNEVETGEVQRQALSYGKKVFYPVVDNCRLVFREITTSIDLATGVFGIGEPCATCPVSAPEDIGLIVVPGVAFDLSGRRIGYGKGYYDKTLHLLEGQGKFIGFSYDFQVLDEIAGEPHDVTMDWIFSETRTLRP